MKKAELQRKINEKVVKMGRYFILLLTLLLFANGYGQDSKIIKGVYFVSGDTKSFVEAKISRFSLSTRKWDDGRLFIENIPDTFRCSSIYQIKITPIHPIFSPTDAILCSDISEVITVKSRYKYLGNRKPAWNKGFDGEVNDNQIMAFEKDDLVDEAFLKILKPIGLESILNEKRINIEIANVANVQASVVDGEPYIFYNPSIVEDVLEDNWAIIGLFAHEIAHHLFLQSRVPIDDPKKKIYNHKLELEADEWAGFILGYLEATEIQATSMLSLLKNPYETITHPSKDERENIIIRGWNKGVNNRKNAKINKRYLIHKSRYDKMLIEGNIEKARLELDTAIKLNPFSDELYVLRADLYQKSNNYSGAFSDVNKALEINPNNVEALMIRSWLWMGPASGEANNYAYALPDVLKLKNLDTSHRTVFRLGLLASLNQDYDSAYHCFDRIIAKGIDYPAAWEYRGRLSWFLNKDEEAYNDFKWLIDNYPSNPYSYKLMGDFFKRSPESLDSACAYYSKVLELDTNESGLAVEARFNRAYSYQTIACQEIPFDTILLRLAERDYTYVLSIYPKNAGALYGLAMTQNAQGRILDGIETFNRLIAVSPIGLNYYQRGLSYINLMEYESALHDISIAEKQFPQDVGILHAMAVIKLKTGMIREAKEYFEKELDLASNDNSRYGVGLCNLMLGNYVEAIDEFISLSRDPRDLQTFDIVFSGFLHYSDLEAHLYYCIALAYRGLDDELNEVKYLNKCVEKNPLHADALMDLANKNGQHNWGFGSIKDSEDYQKLNVAIQAYKDMFKLTGDYTMYLKIANAYSLWGNDTEAIVAYDSVINNLHLVQNVDSAIINDLYYSRGMHHYFADNYEKAIDDFMIVSDGNNSDKFYFQGMSYYYLNRNYLAVASFNLAIRIEDEGIFYFGRGMANQKLGRLTEACSDFKTAKNLGFDKKLVKSRMKQICK